MGMGAWRGTGGMEGHREHGGTQRGMKRYREGMEGHRVGREGHQGDVGGHGGGRGHGGR